MIRLTTTCGFLIELADIASILHAFPMNSSNRRVTKVERVGKPGTCRSYSKYPAAGSDQFAFSRKCCAGMKDLNLVIVR